MVYAHIEERFGSPSCFEENVREKLPALVINRAGESYDVPFGFALTMNVPNLWFMGVDSLSMQYENEPANSWLIWWLCVLYYLPQFFIMYPVLYKAGGRAAQAAAWRGMPFWFRVLCAYLVHVVGNFFGIAFLSWLWSVAGGWQAGKYCLKSMLTNC